MKYTILVDPPSVIITLYMPRSQEEDLKKYMYINFTLFNPKWSPLDMGDHEIHYFLSPYPSDVLTKFG